MSQELDLNQLDRKVFSASFDTGLVDIFISGVILMLALGPLAAAYLNPYFGDLWGDLLATLVFLPFWLILYLVLRGINKLVIKPRMGVVKYGPARRKKLSLFTGIMVVLNLLFMIGGLVAFPNPGSPGWTKTLPFSVMLLLSFTLAGYFLNLTRFYAYGIMLSMAALVGEYLYQTFGVGHHGYPITYGLSAVVIFLTGLVKLITFTRNNPIPSDDLVHWEGSID